MPQRLADIAERLRNMPLWWRWSDRTRAVTDTRRMERFNLVTSTWDTEGSPARRLYTLTTRRSLPGSLDGDAQGTLECTDAIWPITNVCARQSWPAMPRWTPLSSE
jgi:hypothetical protein